MNFNDHSQLAGQHAFLSASKYHWINYDEEKLILSFSRFQAAQRGTELHEFAHNAVRLGIKLPKSNKTLNLYVNDAIGFKMQTEQVLYYSDNCFGTADAIVFRNNKLRIHDLKNGVTIASPNQLMVYAALFCLEYNVLPADIDIELRLYQSDEVQVFIPVPEDLLAIMEKIIAFDKKIDQLKAGG
jgi:hypothetical protein